MVPLMDLREEKKQVLLEALDGAPSVYLHLDARRDGVKVPEHFRKQENLVLKVGYMLAPPINIVLGDDAVTCTLSFNRTPFACELPWEAIYAIVFEDGRAAVWPDDIPPEAAARFRAAARPALAPVSSAGTPEAPKRRPAPLKKEPPKGPRGLDLRERPVTVRSDKADKADKAKPEAPEEAERSPAAKDKDKDHEESPAAERKPKRELPPYLRVIK
jgi:stringent starvation protein B